METRNTRGKNMTDDNKKVPFKNPEEVKAQEKPITEEDLGLEVNGIKSQDMSRARLCDLILILRDEQKGFIAKIQEAELRAKILREEMFNFLQAKIEASVKETLSRILAGLGVKIG